MKGKRILVLVSALIGLIAASLYHWRIQKMRDDIARMTQEVPVIVVKRNISAGEKISSEDLTVVNWFKDQVSQRHIGAQDLGLIPGSRTLHPVPANDPLLWTDFPEGPRVVNPAERIPSGHRAIALPADEIHTLVHFISPGDFVDIAASLFEASGSRLVTRLLAEEVLVLGIGRRMKGPDGSFQGEEYPVSVTLAVEMPEALEILRASQEGDIHFLARRSNPMGSLIPASLDGDPGKADR